MTFAMKLPTVRLLLPSVWLALTSPAFAGIELTPLQQHPDQVNASFLKNVSGNKHGATILQIAGKTGEPLLDPMALQGIIDTDRASGATLAPDTDYHFIVSMQLIYRLKKLTISGPLKGGTISVKCAEMPVKDTEEGWVTVIENQALGSPFSSFNFRPQAAFRAMVTIHTPKKVAGEAIALTDIAFFSNEDVREYKLTDSASAKEAGLTFAAPRGDPGKPSLSDAVKSQPAATKEDEKESPSSVKDPTAPAEPAEPAKSQNQYNLGSMAAGARIIYVSALAATIQDRLVTEVTQEDMLVKVSKARPPRDISFNPGAPLELPIYDPLAESKAFEKEAKRNPIKGVKSENETTVEKSLALLDDDAGTVLEFDPRSKESIAVLDLGRRRRVSKISMIHSKRDGNLMIYLLDKLPWEKETPKSVAQLAWLDQVTDAPMPFFIAANDKVNEITVDSNSNTDSGNYQRISVESKVFDGIKPFSFADTGQTEFSEMTSKQTFEGRYIVMRFTNASPNTFPGFRIHDFNVFGDYDESEMTLVKRPLPELESTALITRNDDVGTDEDAPADEGGRETRSEGSLGLSSAVIPPPASTSPSQIIP